MAVSWPTLGHSQRDSLTDPMLITAYVRIRLKGHREPRNEVGSLRLAERLTGFEPGTFRFLIQRLNCSKAFKNLFILIPKNKHQLKRSSTLLKRFCRSKFSQCCINYRGPHLWNTILLGQNIT